MDIGKLSILAGLAASSLTVLLYILSMGKRKPLIVLARVCFVIAFLMGGFAFFRLMWLIAHHEYQYRYVFDFSSSNLDAPFIYAATWAGQQGSFLLWLVWTGVIGIILLCKSGDWEHKIMPIYTSVLIFLFAILHWLSPFNLITRGTGPNDWPLSFPWPPPDGSGLNPSLQNYWMAIHPPTIFFGFASLAVPFSFAIAAMIWKKYDDWVQKVAPFVLLTVATLGVGLFMGGYWAYETQGWHGFWAWDPVENASLFPWLGSVALLHGLIVQRSRGGMGKTNIFLALFSWLLFIYGTFLTRSGVLANFSVHAFGMLDNDALKLLLAMIALYGIGGLILVVIRWRQIPGKPIADNVLSRDTAMLLAVCFMMLAAIVVTIGTSWPLLSQLKWFSIFGAYNPSGSAVSKLFYNRVGSLLALPSLLIMGLVPWMYWKNTDGNKLLWKILPAWFIALIAGFGIIMFAHSQTTANFQASTPLALVVSMGTLGVFAAVSNLQFMISALRTRRITAGGWLSHVGIGIILLGTILTNVYERSENRTIVEGMAPVKTHFGYAIAYDGWTHDGQTPQQIEADWTKFTHAVKLKLIPISSNGDAANISSETNNSNTKGDIVGNLAVFHYWQEDHWATMTWPLILKQPFRDLYISAANDPQLVRISATVRPGESSTVGDVLRNPGYQVYYKRFKMIGQPGQPGTIMEAQMILTTPTGQKVPIDPGLRLGGDNGPEHVNIQIPQVQGAVLIDGAINPASKEVTVEFEFPDAPALWAIPITITNKPFINFVWIGVLLMGIGALWAMVRRAFESGKKYVPLTEEEMGGVKESIKSKNGGGGNGKAHIKPAKISTGARR